MCELHPDAGEYRWTGADGYVRTVCRGCRGRPHSGRPEGMPACMTDREFAEWSMFNARSGRQSVQSPCADCPLGFAIEMRAVGMCDGRPSFDPEDEDEPIPPPKPVSAARRESLARAAKAYRLREALIRLQIAG